eukprot:TRINITY_DN1160_c0_g1_i1.p1 TRINITY_DN1160_c0_g1~~TRINITY_DN1160_c0_g1_i1.p1  ORF type:complete len:169 (-),score=19.26 TRINITY_DN1160_c0_g1_i1:407-913(-)
MSAQMHAMLAQEEDVEVSPVLEDVEPAPPRSSSSTAKRVAALVLGLMVVAAVVKPMLPSKDGHVETGSRDFVGLSSSSSEPLCGQCQNPPNPANGRKEFCPVNYACNPAFMVSKCCMPLGNCPNGKPKNCTNPPNPLSPGTFCGMGEACLATPFVGTGCCFPVSKLFR